MATVFLKHIFNEGLNSLLQRIAHLFYEFSLSSFLFSVFLFMHLTTKVIRIKVSSYESVIDRKLKLGTWEIAIWSNPGYLTNIWKVSGVTSFFSLGGGGGISFTKGMECI